MYDDFTRPLPVNQLRTIRARVFSERFDPVTRKMIEERPVALRMAASGAYLEARIDPATFPANLSARVQFTGSSTEQKFDFTFPALTREPSAPAAATNARASGAKPVAPAPGSASTVAAPATSASAAPASVTPAVSAAEPDPALIPLPIPDTVPEILAQLKTRNQQIAGLIERGDFGAVWVPAFQVKDLAIALEERHLDPLRREKAVPALQRLVRLSWLLDAQGDTGNRQNVSAAYSALSTAIGDVLAIFTDPVK